MGLQKTDGWQSGSASSTVGEQKSSGQLETHILEQGSPVSIWGRVIVLSVGCEGGTVLCIIGYLLASLAPTSKMPGAHYPTPAPGVITIMSHFAKCPWGRRAVEVGNKVEKHSSGTGRGEEQELTLAALQFPFSFVSGLLFEKGFLWILPFLCLIRPDTMSVFIAVNNETG